MKTLLFLMVSAVSLFGSAADCNVYFGAGGGTALAGAGNSVQFSNRAKNCYDWRISYQSQGFSAVSLIVEIAPDVAGVPGSWITFAVPEVTNPIQGVNPNINTVQASSYFRGAPAWIRARLSVATGTGTVSGILYGCAEPGCGSGMALAASVASGCPSPCPVTGGPISVEGVDAAGAVPTIPGVPINTFDGTNVQRLKSDTSGDVFIAGPDVAGAAASKNPVSVGGFDGTNVQRIKTTSAANNSSTNQTGVELHEKGARWSVSSVTGSATAASASKAAGGAGVRHVVDCVQFSAESTAAIVATQDDVVLRDGATGAGTVLMQWRNAAVSVAAAQIGQVINVCGLALIGTANTAMTLEYTAGLTNVLMSATITGYDVQ
jgi:hypothetical protein